MYARHRPQSGCSIGCGSPCPTRISADARWFCWGCTSTLTLTPATLPGPHGGNRETHEQRTPAPITIPAIPRSQDEIPLRPFALSLAFWLTLCTAALAQPTNDRYLYEPDATVESIGVQQLSSIRPGRERVFTLSGTTGGQHRAE